MSLLREIQEEAMRSESDVLALLRKCRVLASRIGNNELKVWTQKELDGYGPDDELPEYRKSVAESKGNFSKSSGIVKNAPIPSMLVPKEYRHLVSELKLNQGIGAYCDLLSSNDGKPYIKSWPSNLYVLVGHKFYEDSQLMEAWQEVSRGYLVNLVNTVKSRILNFALELESEDPKAGEGFAKPNAALQEKITQIFNTNVQGNVGNIASGSHSFTQSSTLLLAAHDVEALIKTLISQGVPTEDAQLLKAAILKDGTPEKGSNHFGKNVSNWLGKMISKSATGAWQIGSELATKMLTECIKKHYGIP